MADWSTAGPPCDCLGTDFSALLTGTLPDTKPFTLGESPLLKAGKPAEAVCEEAGPAAVLSEQAALGTDVQ
jgi:hypothetical protein